MEIVIPSSFVKLGENIKQGDIIKLLDEGEYKPIKRPDGTQAIVLQFKVLLDDGAEKTLSMNKTSQKNLIGEYGKDSKNWIGKDLKVWSVRQVSFGKPANVLVLTPAKWDSPFSIADEDIPVVEDN